MKYSFRHLIWNQVQLQASKIQIKIKGILWPGKCIHKMTIRWCWITNQLLFKIQWVNTKTNKFSKLALTINLQINKSLEWCLVRSKNTSPKSAQLSKQVVIKSILDKSAKWHKTTMSSFNPPTKIIMGNSFSKWLARLMQLHKLNSTSL